MLPLLVFRRDMQSTRVKVYSCALLDTSRFGRTETDVTLLTEAKKDQNKQFYF